MNISVKIAKLNTAIDYNVEALPATSLAYAITYGLTQALNDAHASVMRKNFDSDQAFLAAVEEKVAKRHEQITSGNVPGSRAPADPRAAMARKLVGQLGGVSDEEFALMVAAVEAARKAA